MQGSGAIRHDIDAAPRRVETTDLEQWLASELHDVVAQSLTSVLVELRQIRTSKRTRASLHRLDTLEHEVRASLHGVRDLLRRLRGEELVEANFLRLVHDMLERHSGHAAARAELDVGDD